MYSSRKQVRGVPTGSARERFIHHGSTENTEFLKMNFCSPFLIFFLIFFPDRFFPLISFPCFPCFRGDPVLQTLSAAQTPDAPFPVVALFRVTFYATLDGGSRGCDV